MPYRLDLCGVGSDAFDRLVDFGALDVDVVEAGSIAAIMPDAVTAAHVARALGATKRRMSPAAARDDGSVWRLRPRALSIGRVRVLPAEALPEADAIRLIDAEAFGTGEHPTTTLCLAALQEQPDSAAAPAMLDVGTGSGVLALAALTLGVARAVGLDTDADALRTAAANARVNGLTDRLELVHGGPDAVTGRWPLVVANVMAAPLIEMAPVLVRRIDRHGCLILSGVQRALEHDVERAYHRLGLHRIAAAERAGWVALVLRASW